MHIMCIDPKSVIFSHIHNCKILCPKMQKKDNANRDGYALLTNRLTDRQTDLI